MGGADNHEALLHDGQREDHLVEAPGAALTARPVSALRPAARVHDAPGITVVADELTSASTLTALTVGGEATGTAATPCVHTVWGLRCPYKSWE